MKGFYRPGVGRWGEQGSSCKRRALVVVGSPSFRGRQGRECRLAVPDCLAQDIPSRGGRGGEGGGDLGVQPGSVPPAPGPQVQPWVPTVPTLDLYFFFFFSSSLSIKKDLNSFTTTAQMWPWRLQVQPGGPFPTSTRSSHIWLCFLQKAEVLLTPVFLRSYTERKQGHLSH